MEVEERQKKTKNKNNNKKIRGRPGNNYHVNDVWWARGGHGGVPN